MHTMLPKKRATDTQWRHKSKISEKLGRCGRQNMLPPYLKIWDWIFGRAVKAVSPLDVRRPWFSSSSIPQNSWSFWIGSKNYTGLFLSENYNLWWCRLNLQFFCFITNFILFIVKYKQIFRKGVIYLIPHCNFPEKLWMKT